jgi:hypothetical protein
MARRRSRSGAVAARRTRRASTSSGADRDRCIGACRGCGGGRWLVVEQKWRRGRRGRGGTRHRASALPGHGWRRLVIDRVRR